MGNNKPSTVIIVKEKMLSMDKVTTNIFDYVICERKGGHSDLENAKKKGKNDG